VLDGKPFTDARGLGQAMHDHPSLPGCLVKRIYAYAIGGPLTPGRDRKTIEYFTRQFAANGYRYPELLREIALSDAFVTVRNNAKPRKLMTAGMPSKRILE